MKPLARLIAVLVILGLLALRAGDFLVVEQLHKADVAVVLAGDSHDTRYDKAIQLLREGYTSKILVDASEEAKSFGQTPAEMARRFIAEDPSIASQVSVCPIREDSTEAETGYVKVCIGNAHSVLLVTSDYHTRRALSIFQKRLPGHVFYVAAAHNPAVFGSRWWEHREWAKTMFVEWQKLLWWKLIESWR